MRLSGTSILMLSLLIPGSGVFADPATVERGTAWKQVVDGVAHALSTGNTAVAYSQCVPDTLITDMDGQRRSGIEAAVAVVSGRTLVSARVYRGVPTTIASDLSTDFAASQCPEPVRKAMQVVSPESARRADLSAERWITRMVPIGEDDPVAVLAFAPGIRPAGNPTDPMLIVLRGGDSASGVLHVTHVAICEP